MSSTTDRRVRSLFVTISPPWPESTGAAIRAATTVRGLAAAGDVDLLIVTTDKDYDPGPLPVRSALTVPLPTPPAKRRAVPVLVRRIRAQLIADLPAELSTVNTGRARAVFARRLHEAPSYDVVWFEHLSVWAWFADIVDAPTIVDIDDLDARERESPLPSAASLWERVRASRRLAAWMRLQRRGVRRASLVAVASNEDRRQLGARNAIVVPNSSPTAAVTPAMRSSGRPMVVYVGYLRYAPNVDAARTLTLDVFPRLRALLPDVELLIIGDVDPRLVEELSLPGVTFTGRLPDVTHELARASVTVLPIRFGAGTRVKALEAFAHGVPVVATPFALYGLEIEPGRHALVASDAEGLALAAARVLTDTSLADRLAAAARELHRERYAPEVVEGIVADAARAARATGR